MPALRPWLAGIVLLLAPAARAEVLTLTLDGATVPDEFPCGTSWQENGMTISVTDTNPANCPSPICFVTSSASGFLMDPGHVEVDLAGLPGVLTSAEVDLSTVCPACAPVRLYDGAIILDEAVNASVTFPNIQETVTVSPGDGTPDRLGIEPCVGATVMEIRLVYAAAVGAPETAAAADIALRAWPNPSRGEVRLAADGLRGRVDVRVLDAAGRVVRRLGARDASLVVYDGADDAGRPLPAGVYFVEFAATGGRTARTRVVLTR